MRSPPEQQITMNVEDTNMIERNGIFYREIDELINSDNNDDNNNNNDDDDDYNDDNNSNDNDNDDDNDDNNTNDNNDDDNNESNEVVDRIRMLDWNASGHSNNLDRLITRMKTDNILLAIVTESWYHQDRHIQSICIYNSLGAVLPNLNRGTNGVSIVVNPDYLNSAHIKNMTCLAKDKVNGCYLTIQIS
jgi:hypothetical protein